MPLTNNNFDDQKSNPSDIEEIISSLVGPNTSDAILTPASFQNNNLALLNYMGDSVFIKDEESRLLIVNDSFCKLFGLARSEIIGKTLAEHVSAEEREVFLRVDKEVFRNGKENIQEETLTLNGGSETRIISTRKSRFLNEQGDKFLIGVVRDITDQRRTEESLEFSEKRAQELSITKDTLISILAHDLRSPFSSILSLSKLQEKILINKDYGAAEEFRKMIQSTTEKNLKILEGLLEWAKTKTRDVPLNRISTDINGVIDTTIESFTIEALSKKIEIKQINKAHLNALTDENAVHIVLRNLISNAIKFTPLSGAIELNAEVKNKEIVVSVSDNGEGIKKHNLELLSKMFSAPLGIVSEEAYRNGFGLVLCKELVTKLGGKIWVDSNHETGTTVKFSLPHK